MTTEITTRFTQSKSKATASVVLGLACWSLVPDFAVSNPAKAVGFFGAEKILSMPPFGGEVRPSVPCRKFVACKRTLHLVWNSPNVGKF
jgi:hypothetical protein